MAQRVRASRQPVQSPRPAAHREEPRGGRKGQPAPMDFPSPERRTFYLLVSRWPRNPRR
jgi:hypothetical protein